MEISAIISILVYTPRRAQIFTERARIHAVGAIIVIIVLSLAASNEAACLFFFPSIFKRLLLLFHKSYYSARLEFDNSLFGIRI